MAIKEQQEGSFFFFLAMLHSMACRILAPHPGVKPEPPVVRVQVLTAAPPGKSHQMILTIDVRWQKKSVNVNTDRENHPSLNTRQKGRWKKNEQSLRTHGQRQAYQHRKWSSQKKRRLKKGTEETFEEIIALKLSDLITITKSADPRMSMNPQVNQHKEIPP